MRIGFASHMGILCFAFWSAYDERECDGLCINKTVYHMKTAGKPNLWNRLEYAYSARRFLPLISLNVFGGRINQPLKQTITHIADWGPWGVNLVPWTNWNVECTRGARGEDSHLSVFLCIMLSTIFACTLRKANFCEHCNCWLSSLHYICWYFPLEGQTLKQAQAQWRKCKYQLSIMAFFEQNEDVWPR